MAGGLRICWILKEDSQLQEGIPFGTFSNEVSVEDLSFSYGDKKVLDKISITIKKGGKK